MLLGHEGVSMLVATPVMSSHFFTTLLLCCLYAGLCASTELGMQARYHPAKLAASYHDDEVLHCPCMPVSWPLWPVMLPVVTML